MQNYLIVIMLGLPWEWHRSIIINAFMYSMACMFQLVCTCIWYVASKLINIKIGFSLQFGNYNYITILIKIKPSSLCKALNWLLQLQAWQFQCNKCQNIAKLILIIWKKLHTKAGAYCNWMFFQNFIIHIFIRDMQLFIF